MIKNYILIIIRRFSRQKLFFTINLLGLTLGLTAFILIGFFSYDELQYEKFHKNYNNLYRLYCEGDSVSPPFRGTPALLAPNLYQQIPEIENYVRYTGNTNNTIKVNDKVYYDKLFKFADSSFFMVFSFKLIKGDPRTVLEKPTSIVITESIAKKLFGTDDPIGKQILYNDKFVFTISGISVDPPRQSHLQFQYVVSFKNLNIFLGSNAESCWGCYNYTSYLLLKKGTDPKLVEQKVKNFQIPTENQKNRSFKHVALQSFRDIHFMYVRGNDFPTIERYYIVVLFAAALLIVLIASVNYNNLSLARALHRLREIGIRKVVGANKVKLVSQHTIESVIFALLSLIFSYVIVEATLPFIINFTGIQFEINYNLFPYLIVISIIIGIISGLYPALFLSSFNPYEILKGKLQEGRSIVTIRNVLISIQFIAAIILISCTLIISNQLRYVDNVNIGMSKDNIVVVKLNGSTLIKNYQEIRQEIRKIPSVAGVAGSSFVPGKTDWCQTCYWEGMPQGANGYVYVISATQEFPETVGIQYVDSIPFKNSQSKLEKYILNNEAVKQLGLAQPLGKKFSINWPPDSGIIVGVVNDYNFKSLHEAMAPCVFTIYNEAARYLFIKISPVNISETLDKVKTILNRFDSNAFFDYQFLDEKFSSLYANEKKTKSIIQLFTIFSLLISLMGIYGLFDFLTERRTKEISVRKILGGNNADIMKLILRQPIVLVAISSLIGVPVSYYIMEQWLQNFAYRIDLTIEPFLMSMLIMALVSVVAVGKVVLSVLRKNPAETLRYE